jgi:hypothetical protein
MTCAGTMVQSTTQQFAPGVPIAVSAIGSLGFGALIGALVAHLLRERADLKRSEREKLALIRLVLFEIIDNKYWFDPDKAQSLMVHISRGKSLATDAWQDARVRLAQLLPPDDFDALFLCYSIQEQLWHHLQEISAGYQDEGDAQTGTQLVQAVTRLYKEDYGPQLNKLTDQIQVKCGLQESASLRTTRDFVAQSLDEPNSTEHQ